METPDYANLKWRPTSPPEKSSEPVREPNWPAVAKGFLWMVETLQVKHDATGLNVGTYSPQLTEAMGESESLIAWSENNAAG